MKRKMLTPCVFPTHFGPVHIFSRGAIEGAYEQVQELNRIAVARGKDRKAK